MRKIDQIILNSAKMVYGVEKVKNGASVPFGYDVISAWSIVGYDTLEELEETYSDEEIYEQFNSLQEEICKAAS